MRNCCVKGCLNGDDAGTGSSSKQIHFFAFPKNKLLRTKWKEVLNLSIVRKNYLICSDHFEEKNIFMHDHNRPRLVENCIPTIFPSTSAICQNKIIDRNSSSTEDEYEPISKKLRLDIEPDKLSLASSQESSNTILPESEVEDVGISEMKCEILPITVKSEFKVPSKITLKKAIASLTSEADFSSPSKTKRQKVKVKTLKLAYTNLKKKQVNLRQTLRRRNQKIDKLEKCLEEAKKNNL